ncbi:MAG: ATP-binding protein [Anaerolineae bacterium]|nr:cell wall metabolism sensor histidine kinase WalK [Anaerolineae bacterium]MDW8102590.1 ATP-binding protein [Anaerolineae bacterium]
MFRSIRWRIAIPYLFVILLATATLTLFSSNLVQQTYLADLEAKLAAEARLLSDALGPLLSESSTVQQIQPLAKRWGKLLEARVTIIRADGAVLGDSHENPEFMENHLDRPEVQQALARGLGVSIRYSRTMGYRMMYVAVPVRGDGRVVGIVRIALPLTQIETSVARLRRSVMAASLMTAFLAGLLAFLIAEQLARRLRELVSLVERMARGNLGVRILRPSKDELGQLAEAFNRMGEELQARMEALADRQKTLVTVLNYMADGVVITDSSERIRLINPAAARILGVSEKEAIGRRFVAVVRDHQIVEIWRRCQEKGEEQSNTVEMVGHGPFLRVIATPLGAGARDGCLTLLQDLTQIRRLETVRRDFISNISHELRTPMAALKALVETLRESAMEDPKTARRFLDRMETEVESLTRLVEELLELSRIEAGHAPMRLAPATLAEIVLPPLERLRLQAERAGLTLTVDLPSDLPPVLADVEQMQKVVANLLHNAIKFTPAGGRITIRAYAAKEAPQQPEVIVEVADTGIGIPAEHLPRIFERFYKVDRARSGSGTGLGLAIAKHIVQAHGGRIWAESVEGQGSTFYFALPASSF